MPQLATDTVMIPLALGLLLGLIAPKLGRAEAAVYGLAVLAVYILLEGIPALPPVAGKQKLAYLLLAAIPLAYLPKPRIILPLFLIAATAWLGWPKLSAGTLGASALFLLAPAVVLLLPSRKPALFLWPASAIVFAIGAAVLSVLGAFVGFAQAMGAEAALFGGILAVSYTCSLFTGQMRGVTPETERLAVMTLAATSLMVALFAPDINLLAYAVLSLALAVPAIAPAFTQSPKLRPFFFAVIALVPVFIATALASATAH